MNRRFREITTSCLLCLSSFVLGAVLGSSFLAQNVIESGPSQYEYRIEPRISVPTQRRQWNDSPRLVTIGERGGEILNPYMVADGIVTEGLASDRVLVRYPKSTSTTPSSK